MTALDREVEAELRRVLAARRPGDAVQGEELGSSGGRSGRRWVLDPVDGTAQFVRGIPVWGTQVALVEDGRAVAAIVSAPAMGRRWWGRVGEGAWSDRGELRVSAVDEVASAGLSFGRLAELHDPSRVIALGAACDAAGGYESFWGPMLVAEGVLDIAVLADPEPWDLVPAQVLVEAAGGACTALDLGSRLGRPTAVLTNGLLHEAALSALA